MSSSWLSLVLAIIAVVGSISGAVIGVGITERRSDRRDRLNWERTRDAERERWMREDSLRIVDQRRTCYLEFEESLRSAALELHRMGFSSSELGDGWSTMAFEGLMRMQIYATPASYNAASEAYAALLAWSDAGTFEMREAREHDYDNMHAHFLNSIRKDLGLK